MPEILRHRTAIGRKELSKPVRIAVASGLIGPDRSVLDYGCGRGSDVAYLFESGVRAVGWDPAHRPDTLLETTDVVNLGYVVNVIEDPSERADTLKRAFALCRQLLIVAARLDIDRVVANDLTFGDGIVTERSTFQKYFTQSELRQWIDSTLGVPAVAASPGIFFVFKDEGLRETYLAARYYRPRAAPKVRKSDAAFELHKEVLQPLLDFVTARGRLPLSCELHVCAAIASVFGSIRRAFAVVRRVTGSEQWKVIEAERHSELLIRIALERFGGRARFSQLPIPVQRDVKALCSSYTKAIEESDRLLFSVGNRELLDAEMRASKVGKLTGNALYLHSSALAELPAVLQVYEGCARAFVGVVEAANIIKLHRDLPQVSYLLYPEFDTEPHPELRASLVVHLQKCEIGYREYQPDGNPPLLHRKEEFVSVSDPRRDAWAALTAEEELVGLFSDTSRIGTREGWREMLALHGVELRGRRLVRTPRRSSKPDDV